MDVATAQKVLSQQMPSEVFSPNYVYRMFYDTQGARTESRSEGNDDARARSGDTCGKDRCFGPTLIHWKSALKTCAQSAKIGVIDTSFDITHPTFRNLKWRLGHFLDSEKASPRDWHGTAVLSLLGGDSGSGTPGLVPDAEFHLAAAFSTDEQGNASTSTVNLLNALNWLDEQGVQYVNMSFSGPRDPLFEKAIAAMQKRGVVFVAAAGNQGPTAPPAYPAAYSQVIAVTAVDRKMGGYRYANRGSYVDLAAPGVEIWTALPKGKEGYRTGTSFAAPFVTAIVASQPQLKSSRLPKAELIKRLKLQDLGPSGPDPIYGQGLVLAPEACSDSPSIVARDTSAPLPEPMAIGATDKSSWKTSW
jgi:subtilisin family serine protease